MKRADYRQQYKDMSIEQLRSAYDKLQDKYLQNLGICDANLEYYYKRFCYVKSKIEKIEKSN